MQRILNHNGHRLSRLSSRETGPPRQSRYWRPVSEKAVGRGSGICRRSPRPERGKRQMSQTSRRELLKGVAAFAAAGLAGGEALAQGAPQRFSSGELVDNGHKFFG